MQELIVNLLDRILSPFNLAIRRRATLEAYEAAFDSFRRSKVDLSTHAMRKYRSNRIQREFIDAADSSYRPTFPEVSSYIDATHRSYAELPTQDAVIQSDIAGWLRVPEALKIYEMAFYANGDILDLGTYEGLSCSIMAQACQNARNGSMIYSVDISSQDKAKRNANTYGFVDVVQFLQGDATDICREFIAKGHQFAFVFVDHSHAYQDVVAICEIVDSLLLPEGYVLFHDFVHPANTDADHPLYEFYGVPHAVLDSLPGDVIEYCGLFGGATLYRKRKQPV